MDTLIILRPWAELTPNERNELIAQQLMGWTYTTTTVGPGGYLAEGTVLTHWYNPSGQRVVPQFRHIGERDGVQAYESIRVPPYSTDPAAVCLVEDEIERRGLRDAYIEHLLDVIAAPDLRLDIWPTAADLWKVARATADQRCQAALRALGVER